MLPEWIRLVCPFSDEPLFEDRLSLRSAGGRSYPVVEGIPRFVVNDNYAESFGLQWNRFDTVQLDKHGVRQSEERFWAETDWTPEELEGQKVLEAGSGAGRFTQVVLEQSAALVASFDYSNAVTVNMKNNLQFIKQGRLALLQASIYEMPFEGDYFDRIFCFGVLQHTPDFRRAVECLLGKLRPGGELVIDFYPIKGWWTKVHAKYILRPVTRRMSPERLLRVTEHGAPMLIPVYKLMAGCGLHVLTRFLPICDIYKTLPKELNEEALKQWVILDTFDMFSPRYDNPQRIETVSNWLREMGAVINFSGFVTYGANQGAAVVRAGKLK